MPTETKIDWDEVQEWGVPSGFRRSSRNDYDYFIISYGLLDINPNGFTKTQTSTSSQNIIDKVVSRSMSSLPSNDYGFPSPSSLFSPPKSNNTSEQTMRGTIVQKDGDILFMQQKFVLINTMNMSEQYNPLTFTTNTIAACIPNYTIRSVVARPKPIPDVKEHELNDEAKVTDVQEDINAINISQNSDDEYVLPDKE